jgi:murein DD-endopeptidase MepM/ murein hydrolase activator NlpD
MLFLSSLALSKKNSGKKRSQSSLTKLNISKLIFYPKLPRITKHILLGALLLGFFSGLQPTMAIPPIKQATVLAQTNVQDQKILANSFSEPIQLPHIGYISTHYSTWHPGLDIAIGLGTPIRPILKGQVVAIEYGFWGLGHSVTVEHESGIRSTYGHMGRIYTKVGEQVTKSSNLGEVGMTGNTSGPHTHLEITLNGASINPETILPALGDLPPTTYAETMPKKEETKPAEVVSQPEGGLKQINSQLPIVDSLLKVKLPS